MQTVLIPTDFNIKALDCVPTLCRQVKGQELNLVFIHLFKLSDSISDLLMLSKRSREFDYVSDAFYRRCDALKQDFPQLKSIRIEFFYGSTLHMFRDFLEANTITHLLNPANCCVSKIHKSSIDPATLLQKCGLPVITLSSPAVEQLAENDSRYELHLAEA